MKKIRKIKKQENIKYRTLKCEKRSKSDARPAMDDGGQVVAAGNQTTMILDDKMLEWGGRELPWLHI